MSENDPQPDTQDQQEPQEEEEEPEEDTDETIPYGSTDTDETLVQSLIQLDVGEVPVSLRGRNNTMRFFCDSNKSRAMIGFLTTDNFEPGKIPEPPDTWFKPADFHGDQAREAQADHLDGFDIASIFIRFESGHSNSVSIQHCPFRPDMFPLRYLVHGTNEKNLPSIRRLGLLPGGTRGGRNHVHLIAF